MNSVGGPQISIRIRGSPARYTMSVRPILFAAAIGLLAACSDTTGPSESVTQPGDLGKAPTGQPNSPQRQPITSGIPSARK